MIKFFRQIRWNLMSENKSGKYLKYALGEILLVMIGILLALQVNNWNENRKLKAVENTLLRSIADDIVRDTIDLNYNLKGYQEIIISTEILLDHWSQKKSNNRQFHNALRRVINANFTLTLHSSSFNEAVVQGVTSSNNDPTWAAITRFYNYTYPLILQLENDYDGYKTHNNLYSIFKGYFEMDQGNMNYPSINNDKYDELISNKNLYYEIWRAKWIFENIEKRYRKCHEEATEMISLINNRLKS